MAYVTTKTLSIGVIAGTFDPVHLGHLGFIERTIRQKSLDKVYVLVEKAPKHKPVFSSYEDRINMLVIALNNHPSIEIYDCKTENYPISKCLPEIKKSYPKAKYFLLAGHDVAEHIRSWDKADELLSGVKIIVAQRDDGITSGNTRNSLAKAQKPTGLNPEVFDYIVQKKLYGSEMMSGA